MVKNLPANAVDNGDSGSLSEGAVTVLAVETLLKEGGKFGINRWWHLELTA